MCGPCMERFRVLILANLCTHRHVLVILSLFALCAYLGVAFYYHCFLSFAFCIPNVLYMGILYDNKIVTGCALSIVNQVLSTHIIREVIETRFSEDLLDSSGAVYPTPNLIIRLSWAVLAMIIAVSQSCLFFGIYFEKKNIKFEERKLTELEMREFQMAIGMPTSPPRG